MGIVGLNENGKNFLLALFEFVNGNPMAQASMYEIGEKIGLDRDIAAKTSEMLIGSDLVEIKTLSGGIGITQLGIDEIQRSHQASAGVKNGNIVLSDSPVLGPPEIQAVEAMIQQVKNNITEWPLSFDELSGLIADIKTIEIQLTSSAPKTAIIRECFRSVRQWIDKRDKTPITRRIQTLLGQ